MSQSAPSTRGAARARARVARAAQAAQAAQQRARLSVVPGGGRHAPRVPFAALVLGVLGLGLVGLLVLNTSLQQGAFHARDLEARAESLSERRDALEVRVAALRSPQRLARQAAAMGMVPNDNPAFLRLRDAKVLGNPAPATTAAAPQFLAPPRGTPSPRGAPGRNGGGEPGQHAPERPRSSR